jgi:hypothetical protein
MSAKTAQITTTIWPVFCDTSQQLGYSSSFTISTETELFLFVLRNYQSADFTGAVPSTIFAFVNPHLNGTDDKKL